MHDMRDMRDKTRLPRQLSVYIAWIPAQVHNHWCSCVSGNMYASDGHGPDTYPPLIGSWTEAPAFHS